MLGLVSLHHWQVGRNDGPWDLFQLQHPASLANWFAVVGLIAIAVLALNIFLCGGFVKAITIPAIAGGFGSVQRPYFQAWP